MNIGDVTYYIAIGLVLLYFSRRALGAVGFRIYWGVWVLFAVAAGYLVLRYCINWDAVSSLADIGTIVLIGAAVVVGARVVGGLFRSAGREWMYAERIAWWRRRWRDSRRHWWHDL